MAGDTTPSQKLAAGLGIDRMHPPEFEAFFGGLHRRMIALTLRAIPAKPQGDGRDPSAAELDRAPKPKRGIDPTDELVMIGDAIDELIDRTKAVGYSIEPDVATADSGDDAVVADLEERSPQVAELVGRITTGATEVTRRLAGLSSSTWETNSGLVDQVRATIVSVVDAIRMLERRIERYESD